MTHVHTEKGYRFYVGTERIRGGHHQTLYNIVPDPQTAEEQRLFKDPTGGYPNRQYIEYVKGVKFPPRYQPTLHGMRETYTSAQWGGIA